MFITNQHISSAIDQSPIVVRSSLKDVETFLKDANEQVTHTMTDGIHSATERIQHNLDDIDKLLGEPIQRQMSINTGIFFFNSLHFF
jgi:Prominin